MRLESEPLVPSECHRCAYAGSLGEEVKRLRGALLAERSESSDRLVEALRALLKVAEGKDSELDSPNEFERRLAIEAEAHAVLAEYDATKDAA